MTSPGRTGTNVHWSGRTSSTSSKRSGRGSPSILKSIRDLYLEITEAISLTSAGTMCLKSARGCTVIPDAPAERHASTASITDGASSPLEFRTVATLLTLTESLITNSAARLQQFPHPISGFLVDRYPRA